MTMWSSRLCLKIQSMLLYAHTGGQRHKIEHTVTPPQNR